jgi:fructose-1,6-bisphosphatase/inositol monophosphatase family enzyme
VWGIALGLLDGSKPLGGFFYMPVTGDYFSTMPDGTLCKNGRKTRLKNFEPFDRETVLMVDGRFQRHFSISQDYTGKSRSIGSTVAHLCFVASGSADAAFLMHVNIWDIAAGYAMLHVNGGVMEYFDGAPVLLQDLFVNPKVPDAILAGHPDLVKQFRELISRRPKLS